MMNKDLKLELSFWGSILDCHVYINDNEIGGWDFDRKRKIRFVNLESFRIEDSINVEVVARGKNGASVKLEVMIEGQDNILLEGVVEDGITKINKSIIAQ